MAALHPGVVVEDGQFAVEPVEHVERAGIDEILRSAVAERHIVDVERRTAALVHLAAHLPRVFAHVEEEVLLGVGVANGYAAAVVGSVVGEDGQLVGRVEGAGEAALDRLLRRYTMNHAAEMAAESLGLALQRHPFDVPFGRLIDAEVVGRVAAQHPEAERLAKLQAVLFVADDEGGRYFARHAVAGGQLYGPHQVAVAPDQLAAARKPAEVVAGGVGAVGV